MGYYFHSFTNVLPPRGFVDMAQALEDLATLGALGFNHMMMYSSEGLDDDGLDATIKVCETHGIHFDFSLVGSTLAILNEERGCWLKFATRKKIEFL